MNNLQDLIRIVKEDEQVVRFKELEQVIDHNESIRNDFNKLLELQKLMVKNEYSNSKKLDISKENYNNQLQIVMGYPIIEEYLDLLDLINSDLSLIKSIIEQEIAKDFD